MSTISTYEIPAVARGGRAGVLVPVLALGMMACAVAALLTHQWVFVVPILMLAVSAGFLLGQAARARKLGGARVSLDDAGMELAQVGQPTRYVAWPDVAGVRTDGELVEVHVNRDGDRPRGLAIVTPGQRWPQWSAFADDLAKRLDASRGYTGRLCGLDEESHPSGGCSNALGCAGHATCQGSALGGATTRQG